MWYESVCLSNINTNFLLPISTQGNTNLYCLVQTRIAFYVLPCGHALHAIYTFSSGVKLTHMASMHVTTTRKSTHTFDNAYTFHESQPKWLQVLYSDSDSSQWSKNYFIIVLQCITKNILLFSLQCLICFHFYKISLSF